MGKGVHPAGLNFGDCFSYALAKEHSCRLLFVGDDFSKTRSGVGFFSCPMTYAAAPATTAPIHRSRPGHKLPQRTKTAGANR
jgi:hypothetical protein